MSLSDRNPFKTTPETIPTDSGNGIQIRSTVGLTKQLVSESGSDCDIHAVEYYDEAGRMVHRSVHVDAHLSKSAG